MSSPGNYLKNEREAKGITIEEVARGTNINKKFLLAIESNTHELLPSHTITIGFLRAYSTCIGIDSDRVVEIYNDHLAKLELESLNVSGQGNESAFNATNIKFILTLAGSLLAIVILGLAIIKISSTNRPVPVEDINVTISTPPLEQEAKKTLPLPASQKVTNQKVTKPEVTKRKSIPSTGRPEKEPEKLLKTKTDVGMTIKTEPETITPIPRLPSSKEKTREATPPGLTLRISAKERAWINVVIDGEATKDVILPENQSLTWKAKESFLFSTGNIRGVSLKLNDMPVTLPEQKGRVLKRFLITGDSHNVEKNIQNQ